MTVFSGCYTAIVTPMTKLREVDYEGLQRLVEFQAQEGISGILAVGTTGESPTLDWNEHNKVIERTREHSGESVLTIAGTGSNSTQEAIEGTPRSAKEATGDIENMKLTRRLSGKDFDILSGDDDKTYTMMTTPEIDASGVLFVT